MTQQNPVTQQRAERAAHVGGRGFSGCPPPLLHWLAIRPVPAFWAVGACAFGDFFFKTFFYFFIAYPLYKKYLLFNIGTKRDGQYILHLRVSNINISL
jgi:hypothetical protein